MRYPPGHKEATRARIIEAAGRVFRRVGYNAAGLDKVMEEAGLTVGGFYAHFESKQALLAAVLDRSASGEGVRAEGIEEIPADGWLDGFLDRYLSPGHRGAIERGCPLAALVSEVARAPEAVRHGSEAMVLKLSGRLSAQASGVEPAEADSKGFAALALCVGGIGLARAVEDPDLAGRILEACRAEAKRILTGVAGRPAPAGGRGRRGSS